MFLKICNDDGDSYFVNVDHIVTLQWRENEWEASLQINLGGERRSEQWSWEKRSYDEDTEEWSSSADSEMRQRWMKTRRQLELFAKRQVMEMDEIEEE